LSLSLCESGLLDLDLLVEESKFIILSDQLSTEDISLTDNCLILFLKLLALTFRFSDDELKLADLTGEVLDLVFFSLDFLFKLLNLLLGLFVLL